MKDPTVALFKSSAASRKHLRNLLARNHPMTFTPEGSKVKFALAIGIRQEIIKRYPEFQKILIIEFLRDYTSGERYAKAIAKGNFRINLDGEYTEQIKDEARRFVAGRRKARKRKICRLRAEAKTPEPA